MVLIVGFNVEVLIFSNRPLYSTLSLNEMRHLSKISGTMYLFPFLFFPFLFPFNLDQGEFILFVGFD